MFALTRRLTLRPAWPEEADELAPLLPPDAARHGATLCVIATRDGGVPRTVGAVWILADMAAPEIGIAIVSEAQGLGFATEAGRAMLAIARYGLGFRNLAARVAANDRGARRLLAKLGFRDAQMATMSDETPGSLAYAIALDRPSAVDASAYRAHEPIAATSWAATPVLMGVAA